MDSSFMSLDDAYFAYIISLPNGQERLNALKQYKTDSYALNAGLKANSSYDVNFCVNLLSAIRARSTSALTVYRMTSDIEFSVNFARYLKDRSVTYSAFLSTSLLLDSVYKFTPSVGVPLLLEIAIPAGFPFALMEGHAFSGEGEVLLSCGSTFKTGGDLIEVAHNGKPGYKLLLEMTHAAPYFSRIGEDEFFRCDLT